MSKTAISWTDETANPLTGCTEEGSECVNGYARVASASPRLQQFEKYHGVVDDRVFYFYDDIGYARLKGDFLELVGPEHPEQEGLLRFVEANP
jgi:hypothetical protein